MRRFLFVAAVLALTPIAVQAQPRLMVGGGFSAPNGDLSNSADAGYHGKVGLQFAIPTLPIGLRGEGVIHKLGAGSPLVSDTDVLAGALSLVFTLPGIGLQPYVLAGIGSYRVTAGLAGAQEAITNRGYHGGFGVAIGGLGLGGFAELRYVTIDAPGSVRLIPLTVGLRF